MSPGLPNTHPQMGQTHRPMGDPLADPPMGQTHRPMGQIDRWRVTLYTAQMNEYVHPPKRRNICVRCISMFGELKVLASYGDTMSEVDVIPI